MSHEPRLNIYTIRLNKTEKNPYNTNKWLFRNMIGEANTTPLEDSFIMTEVFRKFIGRLDTPRMYAHKTTKKCMTANQADIASNMVNPNISFHADQYIIEGSVEGGSFGRNRNKTSTVNKVETSKVLEADAITENFYFLIYSPFNSDKSVLMLLSYSDDSIDSVMKKFWSEFFSSPKAFNKPVITRFIPQGIIDDFRRNSKVSTLSFSTEVPGETLLQDAVVEQIQNYKVTIEIKPVNEDLSIEEFNQNIGRIERTFFTQALQLFQFTKRKGQLKDGVTDKTTPFDLGTDFEIQPGIMLSKYISFAGDSSDEDKIRDYCFELLESIKTEIYPRNAVLER